MSKKLDNTKAESDFFSLAAVNELKMHRKKKGTAKVEEN